MFAVANVGINFDAAVHRARMKDEDVVFSPFEAVFLDSKQRVIFAGAGEESDALPFLLNAQDVDDVGILESFLQVIVDG